MDNQYTIFFYNTGYKKEGFSTVQEALQHLIMCCFEGCILNSKEEVVVSWSPINGLMYSN